MCHQPGSQSPGSHVLGRCGYWIHDTGAAIHLGQVVGGLSRVQPKPLSPHGDIFIQVAFASRNQVMIEPASTASPSDCAWRAAAAPPSLCSVRSVVAAAIPDGKRSCSMLIIWRLAGTARNTPSIEITPIQAISTHWLGTALGWSIINAGMAFT